MVDHFTNECINFRLKYNTKKILKPIKIDGISKVQSVFFVDYRASQNFVFGLHISSYFCEIVKRAELF